ncbi:hypothetical protein RHSIM_Rhsim12G0206000 [Rhododendron simsii]|uniref:Uncharacterized protein n=1 Tax=Rhododendron simsii TaxID=118357 RepID=A0A834G178_RHOSS|nr:hypothetical protein RHSIM_Rhsim12G0206000 [Rhododendron simsii]
MSIATEEELPAVAITIPARSLHSDQFSDNPGMIKWQHQRNRAVEEHRRYCSQLFVLLVLFIISLYVVPISGKNGSGLIEVDVGVILDADDHMVGKEHRRYCSQLFVLLVLFIISLYVVPISGKNGSGLIEVDVGVILDADDHMVGKVSQTCISRALEDFYALNQNHSTTRIVLHKRNSKGDVVEAASAGASIVRLLFHQYSPSMPWSSADSVSIREENLHLLRRQFRPTQLGRRALRRLEPEPRRKRVAVQLVFLFPGRRYPSNFCKLLLSTAGGVLQV